MLEKLLGVSPPQKGLAQDSKVGDKKNLPPDFKKDFERQLQRKLDQKSNSTRENERDPKAQSAKKSEDELRAERSEKKPSGGIKKKMVEQESEVTMISNVMALPKSEFEIPDQNIDLAMIETEGNSTEAEQIGSVGTQTEKVMAADAIVTTEPGVKESVTTTAALTEALAAALTEQQISDAEPVTKNMPAAETSVTEAESNRLLQDLQRELSQSQRAQAQVVPEQKSASELTVHAEQTDQAGSPSVAKAETPAVSENVSFEDLLGKDVGFQSDLRQHVASSGLIQKMKEFESEKGMSTELAQSFEQKVLEQLTQEKSYTVSGSEMTKDFSSDTQSDSFNDSSNEALKEMNPDPLKAESHLHMGQSHTDFKAHMATPLERTGTATALAQLQERRDENVQEVLKQAQFLATKGGGEMTVKMSPDGIGEIQLKVLMQDGRLSIEMQTQDKSVKKLIEDSLTELKSGLAAQQLSVDSVRINTVNATNTENSTQFQSNQNHSGQNFSAGQDQQKEFWKQFQNNFGNQARRGSYSDVQSVSSARASSEPNALQPLQAGKARATGRTGSTLNRVA